MVLVRRVDEDTVECLLTCGHWNGPVHCASRHFDFPDEPHDCDVCGEERQWDLRLQALCYKEIFG